jgi:hypothetical protein
MSTRKRPPARKRPPNCWKPSEAADWAEIKYRLLLDLLDQGLLPGIRMSGPHDQQMPDGTTRRRRTSKWLIPREAFMQAWRTFTPPPRNVEEPRYEARA